MPDKRSKYAGEPKQGENGKSDEREDHDVFKLPGFKWQMKYLTA